METDAGSARLIGKTALQVVGTTGLTHTSLDSEASSMLSCRRNGRKLGVGNGSGSESLVKARP